MTRKNALKIAKELANRLQPIIPQFRMRLYGSFARDEATADSDIDIYIEIPQKYFSKDIKKRIRDISWELSFSNNVIMQTSVYSDEQVWNTPRRSSPFIASIMKEGISI